MAGEEARRDGPLTRALAGVVRRPVAVSMFVLLLVVFGGVSFTKLKVDLLPEVSYPTLTVRTSWAGAAPEDVEQRISEKLQESLSTLDDLVRSTSISRAGTSDVVLEFDWGTPMTFAVEDVRERLGGVNLPEGAERPLILRYDPNLDPILRIGVRAKEDSNELSEQQRNERLIHLRWLAENRIKRELEALEGVAVAQVRGGLKEEIRVHVDPERMAALHVDPGELAARLAQENINASGGSLTEGSNEYLVRTVNQFLDVAEIEDMPVVRRGAGVIRVRDLGHVERSYEKREVVSRIGGAESVELALFREADANIVQLAELLRERIFGTEEQQTRAAELQQESGTRTVGQRAEVGYLAHELRGEVELELLSDQSVFIRDAVEDVQSSAVLGSLLTVLVIWLFLRNLVGTVIVGISIPVSLIVAFAPMFLGDVTLNIMSMGGLALGTGMMLDNAIVILESISSRREQGEERVSAAIHGTAEVTGAMIASTLTSVAVFAPIVFVTGIAGQIFGDQALTVVSFQFISLLMALLLIPLMTSHLRGRETSAAPQRPPRLGVGVALRGAEAPHGVLLVLGRAALALLGGLVRALGALFFGVGKLGRWLTWPVDRVFGRAWSVVEGVYPRFLDAALSHPYLVLLFSLGLLWGAAQRFPHLGVELLPKVHQGEFTAHVRLNEGTPLRATDGVLSELDRAVRNLPDVETTALTVGVEKDTLTRDIEGPHTARLTVRLKSAAHAPAREDAAEEAVRALLDAHPAVRTVEFTRPTPFTLESPLAVEIRGYDLAQLQDVAAQVVEALRDMPGLADVHSSVKPGNLEAQVTFDREKMLELGLDLTQVSTLVRDQVLGNVSTRLHEGDERIGIRVQGDPALLNSLQAVAALPINPSAENPVSLRTVASIEELQGPAEIRRIGNTRAVVVTGTSTGIDMGGLTAGIEQRLASLTVPEEVTVSLGGQKREMDASLDSMKFALYLAIFLVYVVMACQFESLVQPLIIMVTVPLGIVGVVFVLDLLSMPLSVVVFLGLILLEGIVVNNAIVLIDRINQLRTQGVEVLAAVREAGRSRLRPILMTTMASVMGLLPMTGWLGWVPVIGKLGSGAGAELRAPMAITVIAGLSSATLLTLLVIPSIYALIGRFAARRGAPA
ncbi:MAG: efflux RND transporter permease subunit [Planctomycetes bacterium]|nr:efflux RND transporter permease subunit [Planctomycetota bacterium]